MKPNKKMEEKGMFRLGQGDMNPCRLLFHPGQMIKKIERNGNGRTYRTQMIEIVKLYSSHALCKVNGKLQTYTYNELSRLVLRSKLYGR